MSLGCKSRVTFDRDKIPRDVLVFKTPPLTKHPYVRCTLSHAQAYFAFLEVFEMKRDRSLVNRFWYEYSRSPLAQNAVLA